MKKLITVVACVGLFQVSAQTPCENGRFAEDVFDNVTVTPNIVYGQNTSWTGANTTLYVDFYEPAGDVMEKRPLIIWVHGGSFLGGSRTEADMVALSQRFARKGYACASISYRTGFFPIDSTNSVRAVVRAVQDLKGAIRFFYKDAATDDTYRIDTDNIFIGGSSAGAITALHVAYLTEDCELYDYLNASQQATLGGLEGTSGNPGYSTNVKGVLNGAGALARYSWMDASEVNIPLASVHGTNDGTVTYNRGMVNPGVPLMYLDGSRLLHERACALDMDNQLYTFYGAGHVPYLGGGATAQAYMDTTVNFYRDFLVRQLGCSQTAIQPANPMAQEGVMYSMTYCDGSPVNEVCATANLNEVVLPDFVLYPNPATNNVRIDVANEAAFSVMVLDLSGRVVFTNDFNESTATIDVAGLTPGNYFVHVKGNTNGTVQAKKLIVQ
jgi:poly(3-hydroxybutyrate) depolymerase